MGKARIVSHLGDGLYNVEVLHNRDRIEAEIERLNGIIADLDEQIAALQVERDEAEQVRLQAQFELDDAVREYADARQAAIAAGDPIPEPPDFSPLIVAVQQAASSVQVIDARLAVLKGRRLEASKRRQALQTVPPDQTQQAWCADFTEDLEGEVATVEVPGEAQPGQFLEWRRIQLRPGFAGRADYDAARDGQLFHRDGQSPEQVYFNAAILPGVQRRHPQYRIGTISSVDFDTDTCDLTLQGEDSSAQSLAIDPPSLQFNLTGVPIEYMECDSAAFEEGDRVLIEFQGREWSSPKVIGFEKEPRQCLPEYLVLRTHTYNRDIVLPVWHQSDGTSTTVSVPVAAQRIIRTEFASWRIHIDIDIPGGSPSSGPTDPLDFYHWTTSIRWTHARAFNDVVGGEGEVPAAPYLPDEWEADREIMVIDPEATDLNLAWWRQTSGQPYVLRCAEVKMTGVQLPSVHGDGHFDRWAEIEGYDTLFRYTISGKAFWECAGSLTEHDYQTPIPCAPDEFSHRSFVGEFKVEVEREEVGELPDEIDELSDGEVPDEFEVKGVRYVRKDTGWLADPARTVGIVYAREDVAGSAVDYAPGFWTE